jgi:hypothetical protein
VTPWLLQQHRHISTSSFTAIFFDRPTLASTSSSKTAWMKTKHVEDKAEESTPICTRLIFPMAAATNTATMTIFFIDESEEVRSSPSDKAQKSETHEVNKTAD